MPKCKRRFRLGMSAAVLASGALAATAAAATIGGDDRPNRLIGTHQADSIDARGGNDRVRALGGDDGVLAGDGNDVVRAGAGNDDVNGLRGFDRIFGAAGNDTLQGWAGPDRLWGGFGDDTLIGDVTNAGDRISRDVLFGGPGNDTNRGGDGDDRMAGGPDDDTQEGGPGNDRIFANRGRDTSDGGPGDDVLWALIRFDVTGPGDLAGDVVRGGEGNDRFRTRDGELDIVSCGPGFDVARLDFADVIESASATAPDGDCERVRRAAPRPGEDNEEERSSPE